MTNVDKGIDALIAPKKFTLGDIARLERINSPLLDADFSDLTANLAAIAALRLEPEEFVKKADSLEAEALKAGDAMDADALGAYSAEMERIAQGLVQFGFLMPRPDEDAKKNEGPGTAG